MIYLLSSCYIIPLSGGADLPENTYLQGSGQMRGLDLFQRLWVSDVGPGPLLAAAQEGTEGE